MFYILIYISYNLQQLVEDKSKNEKLSDKMKKYEVNIAADKQTIQQLTYKIKDLEEECSGKIMEYDLQKSVFEGRATS